MNVQKDLIQHIAVLTVAPGYLNFNERRSSDILHVGLEETRLLLRDCLGVLTVEDTSGDTDVFAAARGGGGALAPVLDRYAQVFRQAGEHIGRILQTRWKDDLEARYAIDPVISELDEFLSGEHWYEIDNAQMIRFRDGTFYLNCSRVCVNFMSNWHCASMFFSDEVAQCVLDRLEERFRMAGEIVPARSFDPPKDYLWRARTFAPQSPQSMINYWEAMLPGSRKIRIRQMVNQVQRV